MCIRDRMLERLNRILRRSVEYAMENPSNVMDFVRCNAQEMDEEVMMKHIRLYVNNFTRDLGTEGRRAIARLFDLAYEQGLIRNA